MAEQKKQQVSAKGKPAAGALGVFGLAAIVVSSMVGGGIFSLPQNMAQSAAIGAVLLAWLITGIGMYFIANTFKVLSNAKPDLTSGIYMYARAGFGPYMGFNIGWSYWLCQIFGNVGYAVITMDALDYFFPGVFTGGNNFASIIGGSLLIWFFNFMVLRGVRQATIINLVVTIAKIVPLALFILILAFVFKWDKFDLNFWGEASPKLGDVGCAIVHFTVRLFDAGSTGRYPGPFHRRRFGGGCRKMGGLADEYRADSGDFGQLAVLDDDCGGNAV